MTPVGQTVDTPEEVRECPPGAVLSFEGISKHFGGTHALRGVSFDVLPGEVHALLGGNGSGKSTLIKILAGVYHADEGWIDVGGQRVDARHTDPDAAHGLGLRFVHQGIGKFPNFTVAENFALGSSYGATSIGRVRWKELNARVSETLERFELPVSPSACMSDLNAAQQTLVAIARALEDETRSAVLVLDEPTAALPASEIEQVHDAIHGYIARGHTVMIVSHRVDEVLAVATRATFLRDGRHLLTRPVAGMDERAIVQHIAGIDHAPRVHRRRPAVGRVRLEVSGLAVGPLEDVSFQVREGEVVGLAGLVGSGRSTLLRCLYGQRRRRAGTVALDGEQLPHLRPEQSIEKGIAYVPEDRIGDAAFLDRSVRENFTIPALATFWGRGRIDRGNERSATRATIERYSIKAASTESPFSSLSGGNQQKLVVARWLELGPRLLLVDEPTQGVDVGARNLLHELIRSAADAGASIIFASSDGRELADLSDRVLGLSNGRIGGALAGEEITPRACIELAYGLETERAEGAATLAPPLESGSGR